MAQLSVKTAERVDFVDITEQVAKEVAKFSADSGTVTIYVPHTTCGITINESADPDVVRDMKMHFAEMVPRDGSFRHYEGNSDSHIKTSMVGSSETVFIEGGRLVLGTWQGLFLCDFDGPRTRKVFLKIREE
ncbi:MAG: secondary thiamine-phosphate synthase enzyme YjbQ [Candidatus Neomarinimicrobiota bacterium]|nr:secondary thiamine-phosphate synthase enzyme YjbQ [Candidatus Neomarinimicrobiota bacterium]